MPPRWAVLAVLALLASPLHAKTPSPHKHKASAAERATNKKAPALTWEKLAERVLKEGVDRPYTLPATRKLGFDMDVVPAKAALYDHSKTPDGEDHSIYITYVSTNGALHPKDIIIDALNVFTQNNVQRFEGHIIRFEPGGKIIAGIKAVGIIGQDPKQTVMSPNSVFIATKFREDQKLFLNDMAGKPFDQ